MKIIKKAMKSSFARSVFIIGSGTVFAQMIGMLLAPLITRIYSPEEYAVLTVYSSLITMLAIGTFSYELAIPIAKNEEEAVNALTLSVILLTIYSGTIVFILLFFGDVLKHFNMEVLYEYRLLVPLGIFGIGLFTIFSKWAYREKNFKIISKTSIIQSLTGNIVKTILGLLSFGPIGLLFGYILSQSTGIVNLISSIKNKAELMRNIKKDRILWCAKRYIAFPTMQMPGLFVARGASQLPVLFLSTMFSSEVIGAYGFTRTIISIPTTIIGQSVGNVFYAEAASIGRKDPVRLKELSDKLIKKLMLIGLAPLIILFFGGPTLFKVFFGELWKDAGVYSQILAFLAYTDLVFGPVSRVYEVFEKQREMLILRIVSLVFTLVIFLGARYFEFSPYSAIGFYVLAMSIMNITTYLWAQKIINKNIQDKYQDVV